MESIGVIFKASLNGRVEDIDNTVLVEIGAGRIEFPA